jgi:hypothetical protein
VDWNFTVVQLLSERRTDQRWITTEETDELIAKRPERRLFVGYAEFRITGIRWTAGLCALSECLGWWGPCRGCFRAHNPGGRGHRANDSSQLIKEVSAVQSARTSGVSGS